MYISDTIAAISTAVGEGGIGIIRLSGPEAIEIANQIFQGQVGDLKEVESYSAHYGNIINPTNKEVIDEVITLVMKEPKTYTKEDVVEIDCHGGSVVTHKILEIVIEAGARLAEPGEFSKRAFLNGRIDLAQAEAVIDLINSQTETALKAALNQLEGGLSKQVNQIRDNLIELLANLEATIDFPEDEIKGFSSAEIEAKLNLLEEKIDDLLATSKKGKIIKEGIKTAIIGRPNVGKSSLLNALLREKRAIVTDIPGTTRDVIEEVINIDGIPVKIIDTAGIREAADEVEKIGVERTQKALSEAGLVLLVIDINEGITKEDKKLMEKIKNKKSVVIANKVDLEQQLFDFKAVKSILPDKEIVKTSAIEKEGIEKLEEVISNLVISGGVKGEESALITNVRHKNALKRAKNFINDSKQTFNKGLANDFITIDLRSALEALGEITGDSIDEDIIDRIFADFCLGK